MKIRTVVSGISIGVCIVFLVSLFSPTSLFVAAQEIVDEEDVRINAGTYIYYSVSLQSGEGIAIWFKITSGNGVFFCIVDQFGHEEILAWGAPDTAFEGNYDSTDSGWYYVPFAAPEDDMWYVYFSKATTTIYRLGNAELSISIKKDQAGPTLSVTEPEGPLRGIISIPFTANDDAFPIERVDVYIDDVFEYSFENTKTVNPYVYSNQYSWATFDWENGLHNVSIIAYDGLGKSGVPYQFSVQIENELFDYPLTWILIFLGVVGLVWLYCYFKGSRKKRRRYSVPIAKVHESSRNDDDESEYVKQS